MTVASIRFFSDALGKWTRYNAILPDVGEGTYPVLLQLHGLSDDEESWIERSNFVRYVRNLPFLVVLPDCGTAAYRNWTASDRLNQHRYEDLLIHDIPAHLTRHFNVNRGRGRSVGFRWAATGRCGWNASSRTGSPPSMPTRRRFALSR